MKYGLIENILPIDTCILASNAMINSPEEYYVQGNANMFVAEARNFARPPFLEVLFPFLQPKLETFWGVKLIPTYVFARILYPRTKLKRHIDRPACEYSVTVTIGHNYSENYEYPIYMDGVPVSAPLGWGITYKGCEITHWREPLIGNPDNFWIQAIFHYVDANGPYADHAWDKRFA